jgi:integrase/recombinase XerD
MRGHRLPCAAMSTTADRRRLARSLPPLAGQDAAAIERFLDAIWAEQGLSPAALSAYRSDLQGLGRWLQAGLPRRRLALAARSDLFDYLAMRSEAGYKPRSNARLLSTLHAFYAHAVRLRLRSDDPSALLQPPRPAAVAAEGAVRGAGVGLAGNPDTDTPAGLRDRAMLELMYACGLRVSELVDLPATAPTCARACCG